jgi:hypothetical protein
MNNQYIYNFRLYPETYEPSGYINYDCLSNYYEKKRKDNKKKLLYLALNMNRKIKSLSKQNKNNISNNPIIPFELIDIIYKYM